MKERFTEFLVNEDGFIEWVGAGLSALGMISDKRDRKKDAYANSGVGVRADAKASGFNPLTLLASGARASAGYAPTMGTSLAQAGQALTDWSSNEKALELENARLQMDQQELQSRLEKQTLRPSVPGIYGNSGGTGNGVQNVQPGQEGGQAVDNTRPSPPDVQAFGPRQPSYGAHVDDPWVLEFETDAYENAVNHTLFPWMDDMMRGNLDPVNYKVLSNVGAAFKPSIYYRAGQRFRREYEPTFRAVQQDVNKGLRVIENEYRKSGGFKTTPSKPMDLKVPQFGGFGGNFN